MPLEDIISYANMLTTEIITYAVLWALFGLLHSTMASAAFKVRWCRILGRFSPFERLIFNGVSLLAAGYVLHYGRTHLPQEALFSVPFGSFSVVVQVVAGVGLLHALSCYDLSRFSGIRQIKAASAGENLPPEAFTLSVHHRFVRHPLYSYLLLIMWCRPPSVAILCTNLFVTLYLLIGMQFEEYRLRGLYGERYENYQKRVAPLIPWPGRILKSSEEGL